MELNLRYCLITHQFTLDKRTARNRKNKTMIWGFRLSLVQRLATQNWFVFSDTARFVFILWTTRAPSLGPVCSTYTNVVLHSDKQAWQSTNIKPMYFSFRYAQMWPVSSSESHFLQQREISVSGNKSMNCIDLISSQCSECCSLVMNLRDADFSTFSLYFCLEWLHIFFLWIHFAEAKCQQC